MNKILHVDDNLNHQLLIEDALSIRTVPGAIQLIQVRSLEGFLQKREGANRFVLDGTFFNKDGGELGFYLPEAMEVLLRIPQEVEKIVVYSAEDMDVLSKAIPNGLRDKTTIIRKPASPFKVVDQILRAITAEIQ